MLDNFCIDSKTSAFSESETFDIEEFEIDPKDSNKFLLGKGSFASVYKTRFRRNGKNYAMKVVELID